MQDLLRVMKAFSDPNRIKIIKMLQHKVMCVCELQAALQLAQPTVSSHLKMLEEAGLVRSRKEGLWVNYHLADAGENPYAAALLTKLAVWLNHDPQVTQLVAKLPGLRREDICRKS
jgi:ArsR family transcriptional regulator